LQSQERIKEIFNLVLAEVEDFFSRSYFKLDFFFEKTVSLPYITTGKRSGQEITEKDSKGA